MVGKGGGGRQGRRPEEVTGEVWQGWWLVSHCDHDPGDLAFYSADRPPPRAVATSSVRVQCARGPLMGRQWRANSACQIRG